MVIKRWCKNASNVVLCSGIIHSPKCHTGKYSVIPQRNDEITHHWFGFFSLEFCRRNCPSAYYFNYISESEGAVVATCLLCHIKLHEPEPNAMAWHYKQCSKGQRFNNIRNVVDNGGASNEIQYIFESAVSQRELDGQRKVNHGISAPGFLIKLVQTPRGLERNSECQVCRKTKVKPSQAYFAVHRLVYKFYHNA